ncbi:MAG: PilC/PilY family type IV pilus protein [Reinekea sp.]|jgi:type IV pilus assembly protein PilY1
MRILNNSSAWKFGYFITLLAVAAGSHSAEKDFAVSPLFLHASVPPNIMFGVDDSGSMAWETVIPSEVTDVYPNLNTDMDIANPAVAFSKRGHHVDKKWDYMLYGCSGANKMAYDSTKKYTPWDGVDDDGKPFHDIPIKAARLDPNNPYFHIDLTGKTHSYIKCEKNGCKLESIKTDHGAGYFPWYDRDNDGEWDPWHDANHDNVVQPSELECPTVDLNYKQLNDWYIEIDEMSADQQTNFANWFSYYRKREYVAKKAVTQIVKNSTARIGLRTLHNNNSVETDVKNIDDISEPQNPKVKSKNAANKNALLRKIATIKSAGGTPLRQTLEGIGKYFEGADSPIIAEDDGGKCQQNFTIIMSDGTWNGGDPSVGNADLGSGLDDSYHSAYDGKEYADAYSNTLADVAMHYYERDLKPGITDAVATTPGVDDNPSQHLVTYTVAFGLKGSLDPALEPKDYDLPSGDPKRFPGWPGPQANQNTTIDDMWHAAYNGRGLYLNAQDPQELIDRLNKSINDIDDRNASASTVAVTSGSYNSLAMSFRAQFDSENWTGKIEGIPLIWDSAHNTYFYDQAHPERVSILPSHDRRVIVTYDGSKGVPFRWTGGISAAQKALIGSKDLLNYIRGDDSNEGDRSGQFRVRTKTAGSLSAMGDIIHSSPVYVADPIFAYPENVPGQPSYKAYRENPDGEPSGAQTSYKFTLSGYSYKFNRSPMLYVGSNDGMLHGFNVNRDTGQAAHFGKEVFAYVPSMVMRNFDDIAKRHYIHTYAVDGTPTVGDAVFNSAWHTVLVGGLNSGGQGIYALDVSQPQKFTSEASAKDAVLWEFSDADDSDLGYTYSTPIIAKTNTGDWVAIFGNGYNSSEDDTADGGKIGSGRAVLYVVKLSDGSVLAKIDTGANDLAYSNGLSTPTAIDIDGDYDVDYVYAGDLEGNMWKFDLRASNASSWDVAYKSGGNNKPLFTACGDNKCTTDNRQPITVKPVVTYNKSAVEGYLVYFGTGSYIYDADLGDKNKQTLYGIWDKSADSLTSFTREHLLQQEILEEKNLKGTKDGSGNSIAQDSFQRRVTNKNIFWHEKASTLPSDTDGDGAVDTHLGWYLDLIIDDNDNTSVKEYLGERSVVAATIKSKFIEFSTLQTDDGDPCSTGGDGWLMRLNPISGGRPKTAVIDINMDGKIDEKDYAAFTTAAGGDAEASGGTKYDEISSALGECAYMVMPDGSEVCIKPDQVIAAPESYSSSRWNWREQE